MVEEPKNDAEAGQEGGSRKVSVSSMNWLVLAVLVVALLVLVWIRPQPPVPDPRRAPGVGHKLSALDLVPLTGGAEAVSLGDLVGNVTLVNFWATWCPPCRMELPEIAELAEKFRGQSGVRVLAVSCAPRDPAKAAETTGRLLDALKIDLPTYADPREATQEALMKIPGFGMFGYPTTIVVDQRGVIRAAWPGYYPGAVGQMAEIVEELRVKGRD